MRVSNPDQSASVASFFQTPKVSKCDQSVLGEPLKLDHQDSTGFSKLLAAGHPDADAKASGLKSLVAVRGRILPSKAALERRAETVSHSGSSSSRDAVSSSAGQAPGVPVAAKKSGGSDSGARPSRDFLHSDDLPADPRLQDPAELALEAAAAAAIAALSSKSAPSAASASPGKDSAGVLLGQQADSAFGSQTQISDASLLSAIPSVQETALGATAGLELGKNILPAAARSTGNASSALGGPKAALVDDSIDAGVVPVSSPLVSTVGGNLQITPQLLDALASASRAHFTVDQNQAALDALNGEYSQAPGEASAVFDTQGGQPAVNNVVEGSLLLLPAVNDVLRGSTAVLQGQQVVKAADPASVSPVDSTSAQVIPTVITPAQKTVTSVPLLSSSNGQLPPSVQSFAQSVNGAANATDKAPSREKIIAPTVRESSSVRSASSLEVAVSEPRFVANSDSQSSELPFGGQSSGGDFLAQSEDKPSRFEVQGLNPGASGKAAGALNLPGSSAVVSASPRHGTLGANEGSVSKESLVVPNFSSEETTSGLSSSEAASPAVDATEIGTPSALPSVAAPQVFEADSKPKVLPPVHVKAGEVWRTVHDAVQRARSENPNHLAVEVRLEDGSSLGVELRMGSAGLQASFRSESQTLLKSIENQWNGFVTKESSNLKVVSAAFEGRSDFGSGGFSDGSTSGGERRQQMENAAASASLGRDGSPVSKNAAAKAAAAESLNPTAQSSVEVLYA